MADYPDNESKLRGGIATPGVVYLATAFFVFCALVLLTGMLVFSAGKSHPGQGASESTKFLYYWMERKRQLSGEIRPKGSSFIVLGGSSSLYSVRASQIERTLGIPAINWGTHAGLGLDYLLFHARRVLRPGDIALLVLEYDHYLKIEPQWTLADYVIPYDLAYLQSLEIRKILSIIQKLTPAEYFRRITDRAERDPQHGAAILDAINDRGDLIVNHASDQKDHHRLSLDSYGPMGLSIVHQEPLEKIAAFVSWCERNDIRVAAGFPAFLDDPSYHRAPATQFFVAVERFYRDIGVPTLGVPSDYFFEKPMFFDTRYHLNADGAKIMTRKITSHFTELGWNLDKERGAQRTTTTIATKAQPEMAVDFTAVGYPGFLDKVEGLADREAWGRWTEGERVVFHLADLLPRRFTLEIDVNSAFAKNADSPITIRAGSTEKQFTVPEQGNIVRIPFVLAADARTIELILPGPMSPKELGLGHDPRRLGIGLKSMRILTSDIATMSEPSS